MLELVTVGDSQRKSMRNLKETEGNELLRKVEVLAEYIRNVVFKIEQSHVSPMNEHLSKERVLTFVIFKKS